VQQLLAAPGAVDLVSRTPSGLTATMLPMLYDPQASAMTGHLARNNEQWRGDRR
jgi:transcriptional regulator